MENLVDQHSVGLKHSELTDKIIGTYYDVYNELGFGFLESIYEESMVTALREAGRLVQRQVAVLVFFRGLPVGDFRAYLLVENTVLLELQAARALERSHEAQLLHYLRTTDIEIGLLLNFGEKPQFRPLLFDNERKRIRVHPCESVAGVGK
jgi:GxxExxY protein